MILAGFKGIFRRISSSFLAFKSAWASTILLLGGCTLINNTSSTQCSTNGDCTSRGGDFASSICGQEGVCVSLLLNGTGGAGQGGQPGAGQGGSGQGGNGQCSTNKDCIATVGGQVICKEGQCTPLTSKFCTKIIGDVSQNPREIYGVMAPLFGSKATTGNSHVGAISAAFEGFKTQSQNALLGYTPPLFVVCDEIEDPEAAAKHLIENVGVKVILGPAWSAATKKVLPLTLASGTILLLPNNDDPVLSQQAGESGQTWSCKPNRAGIEAYWGNALGELGKVLKTKTPPLNELKVAMLAAGDSSSQNLANRIQEKTAALSTGFFRLDYDDFREKSIPYSTVASSVLNHQSGLVPNLIIVISSGDGATSLGPEIEILWEEGKGPRPYYLFVEDHKGIDFFLNIVSADKEVDRRTFNLDTAPNEAIEKNYKLFRDAFQAENKGQTPLSDSEYFYDCFWLNQYAMYIATDKAKNPPSSVNGASFAAAVAGLSPPGQPEVVGELGAADVLQALGAGGDLDLSGAGSDLDYALSKVSPQAKGGLYCAKNFKLIPASIEFDPETGAVNTLAPFSCP